MMTYDTVPLGYVFMPHHIPLWRAKGIDADYQGLRVAKQLSSAESNYKNHNQSNTKKYNA